MTGPEHYTEAERLIKESKTAHSELAPQFIARAQVHATLARDPSPAHLNERAFVLRTLAAVGGTLVPAATLVAITIIAARNHDPATILVALIG
ncbi:hypothetical protein, partial [Bacillus mobilis]